MSAFAALATVAGGAVTAVHRRPPTGSPWAQIGTSNLIWVVLPFTVGLFRVVRAEVK